MAISTCGMITDRSGRELVKHGTTAFPIACYEDDLSKTDVPWHWHEELEAAVITEGSCTVAAGNEKATLHAGEGFFINSGVLHGAWGLESEGCKFHSLVFHPRLVGGSLDSVYYQKYLTPILKHNSLEMISLSPNVPWQQAALEAIDTCWRETARENSVNEFLTRNALSTLIFQLHRHLPPTAEKLSAKAIRDGERIKVMLSYIHENFSSELSTADIAASVTISESECLRCFRSTIGTTPIQYVKQFRIQQAARMLTDTNDKISDIASACGFQDISYFTKSFKEIKGCVPTAYRNAK